MASQFSKTQMTDLPWHISVDVVLHGRILPTTYSQLHEVLPPSKTFTHLFSGHFLGTRTLDKVNPAHCFLWYVTFDGCM